MPTIPVHQNSLEVAVAKHLGIDPAIAVRGSLHIEADGPHVVATFKVGGTISTDKWLQLVHDSRPAPPERALDADTWNARYGIGTPVLAWPGTMDDEPLTTRTRSTAWDLNGTHVVSVDGHAGGIALTHVVATR